MNYGGGESERVNENEGKSSNESDDFGRAVARIAVAQICESAGFQNFHKSALDALSDIVIRYLRDLGMSARFYSNLSGRVECNVYDIVHGLEDLSLSQGFLGASDVNRLIAGSGIVKESIQYVNLEEEVPFACPIPRFPVARKRRPTPSFKQIGESPPKNHIPDWLPAFPDSHTYVRTPAWNDRTTDPRTDMLEQTRQKRKAERSLLNLQQRLACYGSPPALVDGDAGEKSKGKRLFDNPFLAPPLQFGEKDVSRVLLPANLSNKAQNENQAGLPSVLDVFTPAIDAAKSGVHDSGDSNKQLDRFRRVALPIKRPTVHFKFGLDKKSLAAPLALAPWNAKSSGKTASWFPMDDEKDDKKRRAEQILKEAMENPQELAQL